VGDEKIEIRTVGFTLSMSRNEALQLYDVLWKKLFGDRESPLQSPRDFHDDILQKG